MVQRTNKTLENLAAIDALILKDHATRSMEDEEDRAAMAWWIYQTFCKGDFRKNLSGLRMIEPTSRCSGYVDKATTGEGGAPLFIGTQKSIKLNKK